MFKNQKLIHTCGRKNSSYSSKLELSIRESNSYFVENNSNVKLKKKGLRMRFTSHMSC